MADQTLEALDTFLVSFEPWYMAVIGPAAIAVHDNGHMLQWQCPGSFSRGIRGCLFCFFSLTEVNPAQTISSLQLLG